MSDQEKIAQLKEKLAVAVLSGTDKEIQTIEKEIRKLTQK
jgi:hypothetical protein